MRRWPDAFPLLAIFALPFRLPISADGRTVNLLIPLYLVVAAGTLALPAPAAADALRGGGAASGRGGRGSAASGAASSASLAPTLARGLEWLLFGAVALYALQALYSADHAKAAENIAFFYVPFALLFLISARRAAGRASCCCAASAWRSRWRSCSRGSASSSTTASRCS